MWSFHWGRLTTILVLLPLILISVIACTLSFSSPLTWRNKSSVLSLLITDEHQNQPLNLLGEVEDLSLNKHLEAQNPVYSPSVSSIRKYVLIFSYCSMHVTFFLQITKTGYNFSTFLRMIRIERERFCQ